MREATRVLRVGLPGAVQGESFLPGPVFAATFHLAGDPAHSEYSYGRYHNPSWTVFETALGELEGGHAVVFPSGMAAITDACAVVSQATSFGGVFSTAERRARWGGDAIAEGFIRLSVGCEDADDVIEDLSQALGA
jgi:cystathionine beta-lyase/cystathionine gamma-synthase